MKNKHLLWISGFFIFLGMGSAQPYVTPFLKGKTGFPGASASLVMAAVYLSMSFGRFFVPSALVRTGLKKGLVFGAFTYALFAFSLVTARTPAAAAFAAACWGFGASLYWTAQLTLVLQFSSPERFGKDNGILRAWIQAGMLGGFYLLGEILGKWSYRAVFAAAGVFSLVGFIVALFLHSPDDALPPRENRLFFRYLADRSLRVFHISQFFASFGYGLVLNLINLYITARFGISWLNKTLILYYLSGALFGYAGGTIVDRFGRYGPAAASFLLSAAGILSLAFIHRLPLLGGVLLILGTLTILVPVSATAFIGDTIEPAHRSAALAANFLWKDFGIACAVGLFGVMKQFVSYEAVFIACAALFAGNALLLGLCREKKDGIQNPEVSSQ